MSEEIQDVDALVKSTLLSLGVPVDRLRYSGAANTYITFQLISGGDTEFADDDGVAYESNYRADIYSKENYLSLLRKTEQALKSAGFYGVSVNAEMYEPDTGFFHVPIDFYYMMEV